jgi:radical SAM-linked protein
MVAVRYRVGGLARYLSHAETLRVFQRACARAAVPVRFSEGFNPHPRLSAPLPRSVGLASNDECLMIRLAPAGQASPAAIGDGLNAVLPDGFELFAVEPATAVWRARSACYVFPLKSGDDAGPVERLETRIVAVLERDSLLLQRKAPGRRPARQVDVRPFLAAARCRGDALTLRCRVTGAGTVRVDEMMRVFELSTEDLAGPVCRVSVAWDRCA